MTFNVMSWQKPGLPCKQHGAVLMTTLILLTVITTLVGTSLANSTLKEKMSANNQRKSLTFQAAQSAVDEVLYGIAANNSTVMSKLTEALNASNKESTKLTVNIGSSNSAIGSEARVRYVSDVVLTSNASINADESAPTITGKRFEIIGEGELSQGAGVTTVVRQGLELN
jgi:Tfp pilus assembly protein PilX